MRNRSSRSSAVQSWRSIRIGTTFISCLKLHPPYACLHLPVRSRLPRPGTSAPDIRTSWPATIGNLCSGQIPGLLPPSVSDLRILSAGIFRTRGDKRTQLAGRIHPHLTLRFQMGYSALLNRFCREFSRPTGDPATTSNVCSAPSSSVCRKSCILRDLLTSVHGFCRDFSRQRTGRSGVQEFRRFRMPVCQPCGDF